jgi:ferredoxin-nitrite reductase
VAETYGDGSVRLTPEENILFVNVPNEKLPTMLADPLFTKFKVNPGRLIYVCADGSDADWWCGKTLE